MVKEEIELFFINTIVTDTDIQQFKNLRKTSVY